MVKSRGGGFGGGNETWEEDWGSELPFCGSFFIKTRQEKQNPSNGCARRKDKIKLHFAQNHILPRRRQVEKYHCALSIFLPQRPNPKRYFKPFDIIDEKSEKLVASRCWDPLHYLLFSEKKSRKKKSVKLACAARLHGTYTRNDLVYYKVDEGGLKTLMLILGIQLPQLSNIH